MIVTNAPFAPHRGAAPSHGNSPEVDRGQMGPGATAGAPESPDAARAAGLVDGDRGTSASSPAH